MKFKFTKKHTIFMLLGFVLCCAGIILASMDSLVYTSFNGWTYESVITNTGFMTELVLWTGLLEIIFLLFRNAAVRIIAIFVSVAKLALPWVSYKGLNSLGSVMYDNSFNYEMVNSIPYIFTAVSVLCIACNIVMAVVIISETAQNKRAAQMAYYGAMPQ